MTIIFITLNEKFAALASAAGYDARVMKIQDYIPAAGKRTYYVSPANSLCFMDGGYDAALSRIVFPGIEPRVKRAVAKLKRETLLGRPYLPIGSSIILSGDGGVAADENKYLVVAPTMLLPQNVAETMNAYWATAAALDNIGQAEAGGRTNYDNAIRFATGAGCDIILTSFCCGYGGMDENRAFEQMDMAIKQNNRELYYIPSWVRVGEESVVLCEANLAEQPRYYQNTEWFDIPAAEIIPAR